MAGIALAEAEKYDVLEKIGKQSRALLLSDQNTNRLLGAGSFGIIRKVKRKTDGFVRLPGRLVVVICTPS